MLLACFFHEKDTDLVLKKTETDASYSVLSHLSPRSRHHFLHPNSTSVRWVGQESCYMFEKMCIIWHIQSFLKVILSLMLSHLPSKDESVWMCLISCETWSWSVFSTKHQWYDSKRTWYQGHFIVMLIPVFFFNTTLLYLHQQRSPRNINWTRHTMHVVPNAWADVWGFVKSLKSLTEWLIRKHGVCDIDREESHLTTKIRQVTARRGSTSTMWPNRLTNTDASNVNDGWTMLDEEEGNADATHDKGDHSPSPALSNSQFQVKNVVTSVSLFFWRTICHVFSISRRCAVVISCWYYCVHFLVYITSLIMSRQKTSIHPALDFAAELFWQNHHSIY